MIIKTERKNRNSELEYIMPLGIVLFPKREIYTFGIATRGRK